MTDVGGGWTTTAAITLTNCTISGNSATAEGGGLFNNGSGNHADRLHRQRQLRRHRAAACRPSGTITLTNCTVSGNSASSNGGGL